MDSANMPKSFGAMRREYKATKDPLQTRAHALTYAFIKKHELDRALHGEIQRMHVGWLNHPIKYRVSYEKLELFILKKLDRLNNAL